MYTRISAGKGDIVDITDAVVRMVKASGKSQYQVSADAGRTKAYVSVLKAGRVDPSSRVLADIAHACGYRLVLASEDGSDTIDLDGTRH